MENIDIKTLARELKQSAANEKTVRKSDVSSGNKSSRQKRSNNLVSLIESVNQRKDLVLIHDVRIDDDVFDILRQLKARTGLIIGRLASVLLEKFILEHRDDIADLLKQKPNRLMK